MIQNNIWNCQFFYIGCMPAYAYDDYLNLNNSIDSPKEHRNQFIFNQEPYFCITLLSNLMDEKLTFLPKVFVNKMIKNG